MREEVLRDFLAGRIGLWQVHKGLFDLAETPPRVQAMDATFELFPRHLLALCQAVLERELEPPLLSPLARWLYRSERFRVARTDPDGRVVEEVLVAWMESGIRDPEDLSPFRDWLVTRRRPPAPDRDLP
jgi:hypothetical protein